MYRYRVKSDGVTKCDVFSNGLKRARVLANTLFPDGDICVERCKTDSLVCAGCKQDRSVELCGCWGFS